MVAGELFRLENDERCGAIFDAARIYRYRWWISWSKANRLFAVLLNPSTADEKTTDPTIRKVIRLAKRWGYGGLDVGNVFALRSTDPKALYTHPDPIGPENDRHLGAMARDASMILVGWGKHANRVRGRRDSSGDDSREGQPMRGRGDEVAALLAGFELMCLRRNGDGSPEHPLYVPENIQPQPWQVGVTDDSLR